MAELERRCVRIRLQQQQQQPNWLELPSELVELIMKKLGLVDITRFKAVCRSWYKAGNSYTCGLVYSPNNQSPWLMFPSSECESPHKRHLCFFNFAEQKQYKLKNVFQGLGPGFDNPYCVGSSYGWLIVFDKKSNNGCILNPFSGSRIKLPTITSFNGFRVTKAILSSDPTPPRSCTKSSSFWIVIMHGLICGRLAFYNYKHGGDHEDNNNINNNTWTGFGEFFLYADLIFHNNHLYALQYHETGPLVPGGRNDLVEVWDFDNYIPKKVATFKNPSFPLGIINPGVKKSCYNIYLAKSLDDEILYVLRVSAKVTIDNDTDHYTDECYVYKLVYSSQRWEEIVKTFGDGGQSLFLGENQCISIYARKFPEWKENSLYITVRPYTDRFKINRYFEYVHKVGVYHLQKKDQNHFMELNLNWEHYYWTAFWIVPNLF
ncbi:putative F-box protein At5g66830 [Ziziphus jujuba]|uniref:F-box protein At5g66830 n=1 Tax=Ziziphus jujuba TaxID=326968 RepID=A0A6P3YVF3_ZIZJJ|nr:putative F-box protein At5g66830 [Ziziphus jujuba]